MVRHLAGMVGDRGATAVTAAIAMLFLLGLAAVAVDGSNLYRERGDVQNAADLAALAAAYDDCSGGLDPGYAGVAQAAVNGYDNSDPDVAVTLVKEGSSWRATVDSTVQGFFSSVLGAETLSTGATALARCTTGPPPVIFAAGECGTDPTFDVGGDSNQFLGDLHSNSNLKWQGADLNHVTGEASYVDDFYEATNVYTNNTWDQGFPIQKPWSEWPDFDLDPADYADDGPIEAMYPGQFFEYYGDTHIDVSAPEGVHVIYGDGQFTFDDSLSGSYTFVVLPGSNEGTGVISYNASHGNLTAFHSHILFYTEFWKGGQDYPYTPPPYADPPECGAPALQMSGNENAFDGFFVAPRGMIEWNGNQNTLVGGLAGFNLKYNGNFNTMNTLPFGGVGATLLVE